MARLTSITGKSQVPAEHHKIVDGIVESRGAVAGPFTMLLHCPPLAEHLKSLGAYVRFEGKLDRKSTRLNSSHIQKSRMPSSA